MLAGTLKRAKARLHAAAAAVLYIRMASTARRRQGKFCPHACTARGDVSHLLRRSSVRFFLVTLPHLARALVGNVLSHWIVLKQWLLQLTGVRMSLLTCSLHTQPASHPVAHDLLLILLCKLEPLWTVVMNGLQKCQGGANALPLINGSSHDYDMANAGCV